MNPLGGRFSGRGGVVHVRYYTSRIIANITIIIFVVIRCKSDTYHIIKICTIL